MNAKGIHILLVEDDPPTAQLLSEFLAEGSADRHRVTVAASCQQALAALAERHFDAMLLDLGLPDATGLEALDRVRQRTTELPVVVLTGLQDPETALDAVRRGADDYLLKGRADPELLTRTVRYAMERRRYQREQLELLEMIRRIGETLTSELELDRLAQTVTDEATARTGAELGAFFYNRTDDTGQSYKLYTLSGIFGDAFAKMPQPRVTDLFGPTFRGEDVVRLDDVTLDPRYGNNPPHGGFPHGHPSVKSYLAVPVVSRSGEVLGGLFFGHRQPGRFSERAETIARGIAGWAAIAMDNAQLFREKERAIRAREQVMAVVSHDLRSPLQVIDTAAELLAELGDETFRPVVGKINRAVTSMNRLLHDLLDIAAIESGRMRINPEPVNLSALLAQCCDEHRQRAGESGVSIHFDLDGDLPPVPADNTRIEQVVGNLLGNALKLSPPGSGIKVAANLRGAEVVVSVSDDGPGIDPADLPHIFDRFYKGKSNDKSGAGLGLAIVQGIVQAHGGRVWATSEPGHGARFEFALPVEPK